MNGVYLIAIALGVCSSTATYAAGVPATALFRDPEDRLQNGQLNALAEARSQANALYARAMLLTMNPDSDQQNIIDLLRQVVALDPAFMDAQIKLANGLLQAGQIDSAFAQLQKLAAAHPDSVLIEVALGYTQRLRGQTEDAIHLCTHALKIDSSQTLAMRVLLEIASEQNDLAGGVIHIEDILKAGGSNIPSSAWLNLARLYLEMARSEKNPPASDVMLNTRLPILREAAAQSPPSVEALNLLSDTYRDLGRKPEALKALRRAVELEPSNFDLVIHCAELENDLDQKKAAISDYEKALALNPSHPGLRELLGSLYLNNERPNDAIRLFEDALAESPHNPGLEIDLGIAYEQAHQPQKAQVCFQQVFDSISCPPEAYLKLAFFQLEHHEVKEAGQTLASAQAHFPQSARIRYYEAIQHRYEKNYTAALASLDEVRALADGSKAGVLDPDYYLESALILNLAGQKDRLESLLREGLSRYPDNPELMNELAYFWADSGSHLPEALDLTRRAAALEPENGPIIDTWGWVYFQMGQTKDALPYLQRAAFMTNNDPVVLQHVGDAYLKLGLRREAIATWTQALEKDPRNGDLANRIDAALAQAKNAHLRSAPKR